MLVGKAGMAGAVRHQGSRAVRLGCTTVSSTGAGVGVRAVPLRLHHGAERAIDVVSPDGLPFPEAGEAFDELLGARLRLANSRPCPLVRTARIGHAQV